MTMNDSITINDSSGVLVKSNSAYYEMPVNNYSYSLADLTNKINQLSELTTKAGFNIGEDKENKKENKQNMNIFGDVTMGPVDNNKIKYSMYGPAICKTISGGFKKWMAYNSKSKEIVNVDNMVIDGSKFLFMMPSSIKKVHAGDYIYLDDKLYYVVANYPENNDLSVIDISSGAKLNIIPPKNVFGFNYLTKIVSFVDLKNMSADNPFGSLLPLMFMDGDNGMLAYMALSGGEIKMDKTMLMMMMSQSKDKNNWLPYLMMMTYGKNGDKTEQFNF